MSLLLLLRPKVVTPASVSTTLAGIALAQATSSLLVTDGTPQSAVGWAEIEYSSTSVSQNITGLSLATSAGTLDVSFALARGAVGWAEISYSSTSSQQDITGFSLASGLGVLTATTVVTPRAAVGWAEVEYTSVLFGTVVSLTGQSLTGSAGTISGTGAVQWASVGWAEISYVSASVTQALDGMALTSAQGTSVSVIEYVIRGAVTWAEVAYSSNQALVYLLAEPLRANLGVLSTPAAGAFVLSGVSGAVATSPLIVETPTPAPWRAVDDSQTGSWGSTPSSQNSIWSPVCPTTSPNWTQGSSENEPE